MHVRINAGKCQGHLRCVALAPEVFDCDDLGYGVVFHDGQVPSDAEQSVARSVVNCPEDAISTQ